MYYLRCNHCGHLNEVNSESLLFCSNCNKKITNNFGNWHQQNPEKNFNDYKLEQCINSDVPKQTESNEVDKPKTNGRLMLILSLLVVVLLLGGFWATRFIPKNVEKITGFTPSEIKFLSSDTTKWTPFTCSEGNFTAFFPGVPQKSSTMNHTDIGDIEIITYSVESTSLDEDNLVFGVGFSTYPASFMEKYGDDGRAIDLIFDGAITGTVDNAGAKLISSYYIPFGEFQGRAISAELNNGDLTLSAHFYLVHNVLYCIQVISKYSDTPNQAFNFFVGSFHLLNE